MSIGENWGFVDTLEPRFAAMVARLDKIAERDPAAYRRRVIAAGLLGYAVVGGVLAVLAAPIIIILTFSTTVDAAIGDPLRWAIVLGLVALVLFSAFRLTVPALPGVPVIQGEVPELFALIERTRQAIGAPPLGQVRICDGVNAHVLPVTRLGGLFTRHVLVIGLPLFYALQPAGLEALIAHELGHLALRHGLFVYGARMRWRQIGRRVPGGLFARVLGRFFAWYGPWYLAQSQALLRRNEYQADQLAARVVGTKVMAAMQERVAYKWARYNHLRGVAAEHIARYHDPNLIDWPELLRSLSQDHDRDGNVLGEMLFHRGALTDSHPRLLHRLDALGGTVTLELAAGQPTAVTLLGPTAKMVLDKMLRTGEWFEGFQLAN